MTSIREVMKQIQTETYHPKEHTLDYNMRVLYNSLNMSIESGKEWPYISTLELVMGLNKAIKENRLTKDDLKQIWEE